MTEDTEQVGLVTIVMESLLERLRFSARLIFTGAAQFMLPRENFHAEQPSCLYRATPEELMDPMDQERIDTYVKAGRSE